jgi:glycosyltransferase involved in cell wall biosynthesis
MNNTLENNKNKELTFVIPVYNESASIAGTIWGIKNAMAGISAAWEIVVVQDGSVDDTGAILAGIDGIVVVSHPSNMGYGASLKDGILHAKYDTICIIDADGTYPTDRIPELLMYITGYDMVVGARTGPYVSDAFYRRLGKWVLKNIASLVAWRRIPDLNSGMRIFRKSDMLRYFNILPSGFSFTTTSTLAYMCDGLSVKFVPINYYRRLGRSKIRPVNDGLRFILLISRVIVNFKPLNLFVPLSIAFLSLGSLSFAISLYSNYGADTVTIVIMGMALSSAAIGVLLNFTVARNFHEQYTNVH